MLPVLVGELGSLAAADRLAAALAAAAAGSKGGEPGGSGALLVATTDLTHAGPGYGEPPAAPWMSLREVRV